MSGLSTMQPKCRTHTHDRPTRSLRRAYDRERVHHLLLPTLTNQRKELTMTKLKTTYDLGRYDYDNDDVRAHDAKPATWTAQDWSAYWQGVNDAAYETDTPMELDC